MLLKKKTRCIDNSSVSTVGISWEGNLSLTIKWTRGYYYQRCITCPHYVTLTLHFSEAIASTCDILSLDVKRRKLSVCFSDWRFNDINTAHVFGDPFLCSLDLPVKILVKWSAKNRQAINLKSKNAYPSISRLPNLNRKKSTVNETDLKRSLYFGSTWSYSSVIWMPVCDKRRAD